MDFLLRSRGDRRHTRPLGSPAKDLVGRPSAWPPTTTAPPSRSARRRGLRRPRRSGGWSGWSRWSGRSIFPVLAVGFVALVAGLMTTSVISQAANRGEAWGDTRRVARAARTLDAGHIVTSADVRWDELPLAAVPTEAGEQQPEGRATTGRLVEGEVFLPDRLAPDGVRGLAARLPAGHGGLALPIDARTPPLETGQSVGLFALDENASTPTRDPAAINGRVAGSDRSRSQEASRVELPAPPANRARQLASRAIVVDVGERQVTVAVPVDQVAEVAAVLSTGTVIIVVTR